MIAAVLRSRLDSLPWTKAADAMAVAVAVTLPWSTSATAICVAAWIVLVIPTLRLAALRAELVRPAGGIPALLAVFGLAGALWADVSWTDRIGGLDSLVRLLLIPVLLAQYRGSQRGRPVFMGFFVSCIGLLLLSGALVFWPGIASGWMHPLRIELGIPVKDYIVQSGEFVLCAFAIAPAAIAAVRAGRWLRAAVLILLVCGFLANVLYVATGRTSLVIIIALCALLCWRQFTGKGVLAALCAVAVLGAAVWATSPYLRARVESLGREIRTYLAANETTSAGERLEYWKKSIRFIEEAPFIGHGTGAIPELFRRAVVGETGPGAEVSHNPHNQTFAVAVQLGWVGTVLLYAMWMAHLIMFRGSRPEAWIGLVLVVENIVGSMFNSYLFDFTEGWMYVFGVGALGGLALPETRRERRDALGAPRA